MKNIRAKTPKNRIFFIVLAAIAVVAISLTAALAIAAAEVEYIYFDLAAGNVTINGSSYTGYAYRKNADDTFTKVTVSGSLAENQAYYVYQSVGGAAAPDGYFVETDAEKREFTLPSREPVKIGDQLWRDYITNNTDVADVINTWNNQSGRTATSNYITVSGAVDCELVIDNIFSTYASKSTARTTGGISFHMAGTSGASSLTVKTVGDNRLGSIHYATGSYTNKNLIIDELTAGSSLTVADSNTTGNYNYWNAAIGSADSYDHSKGIVINGGTIFAGTTVSNDCTAIGAGGNGHGVVTINGGTVTAVTSSSGTAIGGGIGKTAAGGQADVTITGGTIYAYNFSCSSGTYSQQGVKYIPAAAIGGGSSARATCNPSTITITGGKVYAQSVGGTAIGGGSSADNSGGSSTVTIGGNAYVEAKSIAGRINGTDVPAGVSIGGGTGGKADGKNGGNVTLNIKDDPTVIVGSIGGGKTISPTGKIGAASVNISGGTLQGQIIMAAGSSTSCSFTMSDGIIDNSNKEESFIFLQSNGGAIYMDDPNGIARLSGGVISECSADNGGALYMTAGRFELSGTGRITSCSASENGGAVYMGGGTLTMSGGELSENTAQSGGAAYLANGTMTASGGEVKNNSAAQNGGAIYLGGGTFNVSGGEIFENTAINGAGAYLSSGTMTVSDGALYNNTATENGGAAYLGGGNMTVSGGSIYENSAINGAGAYLADGEMSVSGGNIYKNSADQDGGGAYLAGGSFNVTGGTISENKAINGAGALVANGNVFVSGGVISKNEATENGGAFSITNGNYTMTGGDITLNKAINGDGGAIYVSSSRENTNIVIRSGSVIENSAGENGGALGIRGQQGVAFTITIGSNTHHEADAVDHVCQDGGDNEPCPVIKNNVSATSGGGIYLSGSFDAVTNLYCLIEKGNKVGDGVSPSNFMKVEGGTLNIDTLGEGDQSDCGNVVVNSSIHVTGGKVTITGSGSNPLFNQPVTVDVDSSQDASFDDKREGGNARTIQYFENFEKQGAVSGQYTLIDFLATEDHVVRANMYTNVGYEVDGWMLMTMEDGELVPTGDIYKAGTTVTNDGDLIFYAKWVVAGYTVVFTPGVDSYIGSMQPQDFAYSDSKELTLNEFINVGYIFDHWVDSSDPAKIYSDGQIVSGLSNVHGTKITLVAVWRICNHNGTDYTLVTDGGTATRECSCLGYKETVTLEGVTAVYDGEAHGTTAKYDRITLNDLTPTEIWNFEIRYSGISFGEESLDGIIPPTNAGNYTASITIDAEHGISVDVIIKKADPEPPAPPKYNTQKLDDETNVIMIEDPNDDTGFILLYQFSWYEGDVPNKSEWIPWNAENPPKQELKVIYTNYYVDVKYAESPNYKESAVVRGNSVIVYTGQVTFNISSDKGILREEIVPDQQSGIMVTMKPQSGYYIYNITHTMEATIPEYILPTIDYTAKGTNPYEPWVVWIKDIKNYGEGVVVTIHFSGVEKTVVVDSVVTENQIFGNIPNTATSSVTISRDSSCTMLFKVNNYKNYETPYIEFDTVMPKGTTMILIDKLSNTYWGWVCGDGGKSIVYLSDFKLMGGSVAFDVGERESFTLALVVDFSRCANTLAGDSFSASLKATPQQPAGLETVPDFDMIVGGTNQINLVDAPEFGLSKDAVVANGELVQKVSYRYASMTSNAVATSKWNAHGGILIVQPTQDTNLPPDARLQVVINNATNIYPLINGRFVVAIPDVGSDTATLTLLSDMIPNETLTYRFNVSMAASETKVKSTPTTAALGTESVLIEYSVSRVSKPAINVSIVGDLPQYTENGITALKFRVATSDLPANYTVRADLYSKNKDNGEYRHTTQTIEDIDVSDVLTLELTSFEAGMEQKVGSLSLMLTFEIVDPNGKTLTSVPLYFVIIDTRQ